MEKRKTQVITGEVRFSYAHVWEPSSINGGDEKYSVSIIIPKSANIFSTRYIHPALPPMAF